MLKPADTSPAFPGADSPVHERKQTCSIEFKDLKVSYDNPFILDCPRETIRGNIIAVLGHNGAGKSTLIKTILGLLPPKQGEFTVTKIGPENSPEKLAPEKDMAFCPETGAVFSDIPVESYIKLWCRIRHGDARYYMKEGSPYIDLLELGPLLPRLGRELSKGQKRRVQTGIGFLLKPSLFLFDEPFDGLDVQKTRELTEIISRHNEKMSFIISSHRMDVIERMADTLVVLREGRIMTHGSVEHVTKKLAGKSYLLNELTDPDQDYSLLKDRFPELLVNKIGNQVNLIGTPIDIQSVRKALNIAPDQIEEHPISLVDAMNYHLKTFRASGSVPV